MAENMPRLCSLTLLLSGLWPPSLSWGGTRILCSAESVQTFSGTRACLRSNTSLGKYWHTLEENKSSQKKTPSVSFFTGFTFVSSMLVKKTHPNNIITWRKYQFLTSEKCLLQQLWTLQSGFASKPSERLVFTLRFKWTTKKSRTRGQAIPSTLAAVFRGVNHILATHVFSDQTGCQHGWLRLDAWLLKS